MNKIILIFVAVLAISFTSAIYEGTNIIDSGLTQIVTYEILNNITWVNATQISNSSILITIPELTENLSFSILFKGYKNEEEKIVYINSGGGSHTKTIYKNNTIFQDKIKYQDREIIKEINNTITLTENIPNKIDKRILIGLIVAVILLVIILIIYLREKNKLKQFIKETI